MPLEREFLSCDWGTTAFRLRWISRDGQAVLREIREPSGSKALLADAAALGDTSEAGRARVYAEFLHKQLESWAGWGTRPLPLVISGMASSSVGWRELPYARVPLPLDGRDLPVVELSWNKPGWVGPTWLVSGVATETDIMRGEETQAIGLLADPPLAAWRESCLLVLPGTHSKHLVVRQGAVVDFRTYMTGELFEVLAKHSLLKASTDLAAITGPLLDAAREAFTQGVLWSRDRGLAGGLFRTRTRAVLDRCSAGENTWFLSGLLIGAEVQEMVREPGRFLLGGTGLLGELYRCALETLGSRPESILCLPAAQVERAVVLGHATLLKQLDT